MYFYIDFFNIYLRPVPNYLNKIIKNYNIDHYYLEFNDVLSVCLPK